MCLIKYFYVSIEQSNEANGVEDSRTEKQRNVEKSEQKEKLKCRQREEKYGSRATKTKITVINLRLSMDR